MVDSKHWTLAEHTLHQLIYYQVLLERLIIRFRYYAFHVVSPLTYSTTKHFHKSKT
jgi:hypothetical protein